MPAADLLGSDKLDKFSELTASAAVYAKHTLLVHCNVVKLQRHLVLGVSTHDQHAALHTFNVQDITPCSRRLFHMLIKVSFGIPVSFLRKPLGTDGGVFTDWMPFLRVPGRCLQRGKGAYT